MKKNILAAFAALIILCPAIIKAQDYTHSLGADPIAFIESRLILTYETRISSANSYTIFANIEPQSPWTGIGAGGSYRWYLDVGDGQKALEGFSVAPLAYIMYWSPSGDSVGKSGVQLSIGGSAAYKWIFSGGFVIEPELVLSFPLNSLTSVSFSDRFLIGVTAGYAWK